MFSSFPLPSFHETARDTFVHPAISLGQSFLKALGAQDYKGLEQLFSPQVRFRAQVPGEEMQGNTAEEAAGLLQSWFGESDELQVLQSAAAPMAETLYLSYRLRLHDEASGWQVIEQHAFAEVQNGKIAELRLICSGFHPGN